MKTIYSVLFMLSLCCVNISAQQNYKRCLDGDMIRWSFLNTAIADAVAYSVELVASGDVLINDYSYKKIYHDYFDDYLVEETNTNWQNHTPYLGEETQYFIRESEDASKLYVYDSWTNEEYLISNMNLQVGDVFRVFTPYTFSDAIVESVYFENELKHIHLNWTTGASLGGSPSPTFIEGVGPDKWYINPFNAVVYLNCFKNSSIFYKKESPLEFMLPNSYPCGCMEQGSGISDNLTDSPYELNITQEGINVSFKNEDKGNVSLLEINGKTIYYIEKQQITIPTFSIPKGVYLLKITTKELNKVYKIIL